MARPPTHGLSKHPLVNTWAQMKARCDNPRAISFKNYGARGIKVCARWQSFPNFLADMGERPPGTTLDRINNDGDYEPSNCRWATLREQRASSRVRGERVRTARLTERMVREIRALRARGLTQQKIADLYDVDQTSVSALLNGRSWAHV